MDFIRHHNCREEKLCLRDGTWTFCFSLVLWSEAQSTAERMFINDCWLVVVKLLSITYRLTESHVAAVLYVELDPVLHRETAAPGRFPLRRPGSGSGD